MSIITNASVENFSARVLPEGGVHLEGRKAELYGRIPVAVGQEALRVAAASNVIASLIGQLHDARDLIDPSGTPHSVLGHLLQTDGISISDLRATSLSERQIDQQAGALRDLGLVDIVETATDALLFLATADV